MAAASPEDAKTLADPLPMDADIRTAFEEALTYHKDFPKEGITFVDFFPVFRDAALVKKIVAEHATAIAMRGAMTGVTVTHVAGLDSRGFMLGPMIAAEMNLPFVPVRKAGKLPGKTIMAEYKLEYGSAKLEVQEDAVPKGATFAVVDDLLATGGTMTAAVGLLMKAGAKVDATYVAIELAGLGAASKVGAPVFTVCSVSDEDLSSRVG